jgi:hypothetical protein
MGGGLMQLVAYGAQDIYLTGNPQITFFKVVYRRHTNFAVESIEQTFNGQADFGKRVTATISRNGDLIQQMYLEVVLPQLTQSTDQFVWTYGVGNALVKQAEIEIGGQLIDRHYGDWMNIWTELTMPAGKRNGYDNMVGNTMKTGSDQVGSLDADASRKRLYVPFQFWFNRNPGLALPLIALQYHEVKLNLEIRPVTDLVLSNTAGSTAFSTGTLSGQNFKLYVDYVYLDTDERRRFAQVSHEYLIEQVQFTGTETVANATTNKNVTLNFNHPVKELIWAHTTSNRAQAYSASVPGSGCWFDYSGDVALNSYTAGAAGVDSFTTALLQLNGHDRFSVRYADYFRKVQNLEHHTRVPRVGADLAGQWADAVQGALRQYIYSYSFALSPEEHQPSGTCNFSRIDNAVLQLTYGADSGLGAAAGVPALVTGTGQSLNLNIYAVNYNVLRIMSGMGGLAYSN